eukprot:CAMPEP_0185029526 /NCGR_PEP_ID=MMETSP1103-20130426/15880_1 /TAXON_ID=36769 /ORGANISM="Paraphysomonas bandaiensis, Strain Caron Lab Isolate" /LENGTH=107 /DNA_ID=CAMNT_0027564313 /DNA_START=324 /DNA_END=647 /DNA_ORIENTATION=+
MAKYREKIARRKSTQNSEAYAGSPASHKQPTGQATHTRKNNASTEGRAGKQASKSTFQSRVDEEILLEKEEQIRDLQETVEILELKIAKLEQLVRLKDNKIQKLLQK